MMSAEKTSKILRHIKKVEDNCNLLARHFELTDPDFARELVLAGRLHDASKLERFEFDHLWEGDERFGEALRHHHKNNPHHPEHWPGGIKEMPQLRLAEMVCDCLARSQEFGSDVNDYLFNVAPKRFGYERGDQVWSSMEGYLYFLLTPKFNSNTQHLS